MPKWRWQTMKSSILRQMSARRAAASSVFRGSTHVRAASMSRSLPGTTHPSPFVDAAHLPNSHPISRDTDMIVTATGYRANIPMMRDGRDNILRAGRNGSAALIDRNGNLCDPQGKAIPGLLGLGLGFGRSRSDIGEPSYRGAPGRHQHFPGTGRRRALREHPVETSTQCRRTS